MKRRVKIDSSLAVAGVLLTVLFVRYPQVYLTNQTLDNILDFVGIFLILEGTVARMAARGHKKVFSEKSTELVTTGPYQLVRNPMYLGSFLIGLGFVLILWPWWSVPFFIAIFLSRFNRQMDKEEKFLTKTFGQEYEDYCRKVPRFFPSFQNLDVNPRELMNKEELFSTKEKFGLLTWPLLALALETFEDVSIFGITDLHQTVVVFLSAVLVYAMGFIIMHKTVDRD